MKEPVVVDSTCLIGLERINTLDVLPALFEPILAPPEVEREFGASLPWLNIEAPAHQALVNALKMLVDDGEAEAIALASERKHKIILDDRQARMVAKRLGVSVIGTIGCLLKAKTASLISDIKPLLNGLEDKGFYFSDALKEEALRLAGE